MGEKLLAGLVTTAAIAPICSVCILGPAFVGSVAAGVSGWLGGLDPVSATGLAIVGALLVYGFLSRRRRRPTPSRRALVPVPERAAKRRLTPSPTDAIVPLGREGRSRGLGIDNGTD